VCCSWGGEVWHKIWDHRERSKKKGESIQGRGSHRPCVQGVWTIENIIEKRKTITIAYRSPGRCAIRSADLDLPLTALGALSRHVFQGNPDPFPGSRHILIEAEFTPEIKSADTQEGIFLL
jgi:hypothetical protein